MARLRKWIIKKLGGYTKEEFEKIKYQPPLIKYEIDELVKISVVENVKEIEMANLPPEYLEKIIRKKINFKLMEYIYPELVSKENLVDCSFDVYAEIYIPKRYTAKKYV